MWNLTLDQLTTQLSEAVKSAASEIERSLDNALKEEPAEAASTSAEGEEGGSGRLDRASVHV